jgi:hypothetical protein
MLTTLELDQIKLQLGVGDLGRENGRRLLSAYEALIAPPAPCTGVNCQRSSPRILCWICDDCGSVDEVEPQAPKAALWPDKAFCKSCEAFPIHGYCKLKGCPLAPPS